MMEDSPMTSDSKEHRPADPAPSTEAADATEPAGTALGLKGPKQKPGEHGGPAGPEPTRYGDWEVGGRCSDF